MKTFLTIFITIIITATASFYYCNKVFSPNCPIAQKTDQVSLLEESSAKNSNSSSSIESSIYEIAKNKDIRKIDLVLNKGGNNNLLVVAVKDYSDGFSFEYPAEKWPALNYRIGDLTAHGGCESDDGSSCLIDTDIFKYVANYSFCNSFYDCDSQTTGEEGFQITAWNAKYNGRKENPNFYLEGGNIFITETKNIIFTYKPNTNQPEYSAEISAIIKTFQPIEVDL